MRAAVFVFRKVFHRYERREMAEELLTLEQVADYLQVARYTIYRLLANKELPAFKVGDQWRFYRKIIDAWLRRNSNMQREGLH